MACDYGLMPESGQQGLNLRPLTPELGHTGESTAAFEQLRDDLAAHVSAVPREGPRWPVIQSTIRLRTLGSPGRAILAPFD